jgi:hypothetical protein
MEEILKQVNDVLRAYNYLAAEDEDMKIEEIPSLVSHLMLLKIFAQECVRFNIPYEQVEDFSDFAIDYLYEREEKGDDFQSIDIEDIVDAFRSKGVKH